VLGTSNSFFSIFFNLVVTIILGLDIFNKDEAYYTVIAYVGFLAGVLFMMEISKFFYDRTEESVEEGKPIGFLVPGQVIIQSNSINSIPMRRHFSSSTIAGNVNTFVKL
jgi:hypothetical protein